MLNTFKSGRFVLYNPLAVRILVCAVAALLCAQVFAGGFGISRGIDNVAQSAIERAVEKDVETGVENEFDKTASGIPQTVTQPIAEPQPGILSDQAVRLNTLADIRVHSTAELAQILMRVDALLQAGQIALGTRKPVVFLLHGDEARVMFKQNYLQNKNVVDTAARLSAFGVVDIKVCERWMGSDGLDKNNLQPFVEPIPFAPAEIRRLLEEQGYVYF